MDQKVSKESFKAYRDWQRYILASKPKLTNGCTKATLVAYCFAMASHGANGQRCFASDATIAGELGKNQAKLVRPYRHEALRLGWFVWTGEMKGRSQVLDIAIPEVAEMSPRGENSAEHDQNVTADRCEACAPYVRKVYDGEMTAAQVVDIHKGLGC